MKNFINIKRGDLWLTAGLLVLAIAAAILLPMMLSEGETVSVERDGEVIACYPLSVDCSVRLESDYGYNLLVIENGSAYVKEADCRCGVCSAHAPISKEGETVICLPHKLVIRIVKEAR